ncbi:hypothetical protein [Bartonella sp. MM73XJBT]|uniref:hypothetical protein n=1 Tax=Bartonella sp. MM73XJBT TaxID=3019095 RepID=UPI00235E2F9D|nr:hypothetical protein [Bartonella sp. MM73XJBT]
MQEQNLQGQNAPLCEGVEDKLCSAEEFRGEARGVLNKPAANRVERMRIMLEGDG